MKRGKGDPVDFHRDIPGLNTALHSSSFLLSGNDILLSLLSSSLAFVDADFSTLVRKIRGRCQILNNDIPGLLKRAGDAEAVLNLRAGKVENDRRRMN
jgi:hypothetical protein